MIRLAVRVRREDAEVVLAELVGLAPTGVEEREDGDVVEYAIYGVPGEVPSLPDLRAAAGGALVDVRTTEVADDWADRWRTFHRPVLVSDRLYVRPPWEPALERGDVMDLVVDPGRAFGTGAHHTTRLCLELLVGLADEGDRARGGGPTARGGPGAAAGGPTPDGPGGEAGATAGHPGPRGPVLDLGCGSGVLAIAAAGLGWGPVLGVDHERASVEATRENAGRNGVRVEASAFDLLRDGPATLPPWGATSPDATGLTGDAADTPEGPPAGAGVLVLANLLRPLLLRVAADGFVASGGGALGSGGAVGSGATAGAGGPTGGAAVPDALIASGLLRHETDEVVAAFGRLGLREAERREDGDWAATLLRRS